MGPSIEQLLPFVNSSHNPSNPRANVEPVPAGFHPRIHKQCIRWIASLLGVVGIFISFNPESLWAATISATSCSRNDVGAAVDSAENGDTVLIPAGNCTWTTSLTVADKYLTIQGAGSGLTIITDGVSKALYPNIPQVLHWTPKDGGLSRLTGITFKGGLVKDGNRGIVVIIGPSRQVRVDHCKFIPTNTSALFVYGVEGVIDHNLFDLSAHGGYAIYVMGDGYGDASWAKGSTLGTVENMFVEDNVIMHDQTKGFHYYGVDGWSGSRVVYRYNQFIATTIGNHGTESAGRWRSQRQFEIYNNTWTWDMMGNAFSSVIGVRGGTGVVFNNTLTITNGLPSKFLIFQHYRAFTSYPPWGLCPGPWDLRADRCIDQTGVGQGVLLSPDFSMPAPVGWPNQVDDPAYIWNNTINGVVGIAAATTPTVVRENRDFYQKIKPGYTPYTYPHPLVTSSGTRNSPPSAPEQLSVR
jgi:hypothetical protein